jgi:hypothetical protein
MQFDFSIYHSGIVVVTPQTQEARDWCGENLQEGSDGSPVNCERNYAEDICRGILRDGLTIEKDGMRMVLEPDGDYDDGFALILKPKEVPLP